jgi:hypothetical protein
MCTAPEIEQQVARICNKQLVTRINLFFHDQVFYPYFIKREKAKRKAETQIQRTHKQFYDYWRSPQVHEQG